ncbi:MAG: hypothetical protein CVV44_04140 [Spirochaetae bacterium HGW-Spirochaetae-1]|jgi:hypothetical protein|nr:MAG: hypothetical protein CVV44_04140 [Spirochaetae bacterium HGW-Spirochaetae-1]
MSDLIRLKKKQFNFDQVCFVASVIDLSLAEIKPVFRFICSTGKDIVATDAKRLFIAACEMPEGYYELIKRTKSEIILHKTETEVNFPNWQAVIPEKYETWTSHRYMPSIRESSYARLSRKLPDQIGLSYRMLHELCVCGIFWKVFIPPEESQYAPIPFESTSVINDRVLFKAFIMPLKLREDD